MLKDNSDILEGLRAELNFIEKGGYGRSVRTPWQPTSIFQDSPACLNFADRQRTHPCGDCLLINFVPADGCTESVPCHHIPLNELGETAELLERTGNQEHLEEALKNWLRTTIKRIEEPAPGSRTVTAVTSRCE
jgi:hypothetical protein